MALYSLLLMTSRTSSRTTKTPGDQSLANDEGRRFGPSGCSGIHILDGDYADIQEYRWSPDGTKIAYTCSDPESHVGSSRLRHERGRVRSAPADARGCRLVGGPVCNGPRTRSRSPFNRWQQAPGQHRLPEPSDRHRARSMAARSSTLGPTPAVDTDFIWSPDGKTGPTLPTLQSDPSRCQRGQTDGDRRGEQPRSKTDAVRRRVRGSVGSGLRSTDPSEARPPGPGRPSAGALPRASLNLSDDGDAIECRAWPPWSRRIRGDRGPARPRRTGEAGRS